MLKIRYAKKDPNVKILMGQSFGHTHTHTSIPFVCPGSSNPKIVMLRSAILGLESTMVN